MLAAARGPDLHRLPPRGSCHPHFAERLRSGSPARRRAARFLAGVRLTRRRAAPPRPARRAWRNAARAARRHQRRASITHPDRRPLADVLTCIREKCTIAEAGYRLEANAERHLKPPRRWRACSRSYPEAVARTLEIAEAHPLHSRRAALRISRRAGAAGQDPAAATWRS